MCTQAVWNSTRLAFRIYRTLIFQLPFLPPIALLPRSSPNRNVPFASYNSSLFSFKPAAEEQKRERERRAGAAAASTPGSLSLCLPSSSWLDRPSKSASEQQSPLISIISFELLSFSIGEAHTHTRRRRRKIEENEKRDGVRRSERERERGRKKKEEGTWDRERPHS